VSCLFSYPCLFKYTGVHIKLCSCRLTTGVISVAGTAKPPGPPKFVLSWIRVAQSLVFYVVFYRSLFVLLSFFLLAIVFFVLLRFTAAGFPLTS